MFLNSNVTSVSLFVITDSSCIPWKGRCVGLFFCKRIESGKPSGGMMRHSFGNSVSLRCSTNAARCFGAYLVTFRQSAPRSCGFEGVTLSPPSVHGLSSSSTRHSPHRRKLDKLGSKRRTLKKSAKERRRLFWQPHSHL